MGWPRQKERVFNVLFFVFHVLISCLTRLMATTLTRLDCRTNISAGFAVVPSFVG